jgi:TonB family protein
MRIHRSPRGCIAVCVSLLLAWAAPPAVEAQSLAQNNRCDPADPRRVAIADGRVSLVLPEGMSLPSDEVMAHRFGAGPFPELVVSNETALIFVRFVDEEARVDSQDYQDVRSRVTSSSRGFGRWVARGVVEQGGARWLLHEYTVRDRGATEHHRRYLTAYGGRTLEAAFVNVASHAEWGAEMDYAAASLELGGCGGDAALASEPPGAGVVGPSAAPASQRPSVPGAGAAVCEEWKLREDVRAGDPRRWALLDGRLTVAPIPGGVEVTPAVILRTLGDLPMAAWIGDSAWVSIQFLPDTAMVDSASFQRGLERRIAGEAPPNVRWISREVVELGGARWLRMAYWDRSMASFNTYRVVYAAPFQGRTLSAMFAGVPSQATALDQAAATLTLRDCKLAQPLDAWVDSAGLARAAAELPPPALEPGVRPIFRVGFDTAGALLSIDPVFEQIPPEYVAAAAAAIRANLKAQPGWYDWSSYYVRVSGGPAPVVDDPDVTTRAPVWRNEGAIKRRLSNTARTLTYQPDARRSAAAGIYVDFRVSAGGAVDAETIRFVRASGFASVDNAVRDAVRLMRFDPGEIDGIRAPIWVRMPILLLVE